MSDISDVHAIIVHHKSLHVIKSTIQSLLDQGLTPNQLLIVDNSEDGTIFTGLTRLAPPASQVITVANNGYGAAVNSGLDRIASSGLRPTYILVVTHESRSESGTLMRLIDALDGDSSAAAAGPTLVNADLGQPRIWSEGGFLTKMSLRPKHHNFAGARASGTQSSPLARSWLDGAHCLYRRTDIESQRFDEDFFLYLEDVELHVRLRRDGRTVLWVPTAVAWQASHGIPPYWYARNLRLFYLKTGHPQLATFAARVLATRRALSLLSKRDLRGVRELFRGTTAPLRKQERPLRRSDHPKIHLVNPLGLALNHYANQVEATLNGSGAAVATRRLVEPGVGGGSRASWALMYIGLLMRTAVSVRFHRNLAVSVWPVLGYWDILIAGMLWGRRGYVVMHDPLPLVKAVGYGRVARRLATHFFFLGSVIVHSDAAVEDLDGRLSQFFIEHLPHPIGEPTTTPRSDNAGKSTPVVRVLGQYKAGRDIAALQEISRNLGEAVRLEIVGKGWPPVTGWAVNPNFVPEAQLVELISSSNAIIIPYARFYQSNIAMRALESAVPVVGPANSSLADIYGVGSLLLVGPRVSWSQAVINALRQDPSELNRVRDSWLKSSRAAWSTYFGVADEDLET